jgi:cell wall-associated NlpC family hydrolase
MKKKIAAVSIMVFVIPLTMCSGSLAIGEELPKQNIVNEKFEVGDVILQLKKENDIRIEKEKQEQLAIERQARVERLIANLSKYVGVTPYISWASSPSGWDCSGLVMWGYRTIDIDLYHGATKQRDSGTIVSDPQPGDIVVFGWAGQHMTQHSGIYIGDGLMIHSGGKEGDVTSIVSVDKWAKWNGNTAVTYTRVF